MTRKRSAVWAIVDSSADAAPEGNGENQAYRAGGLELVERRRHIRGRCGQCEVKAVCLFGAVFNSRCL